MNKVTLDLDEFADQTSLLPGIVAQTVIAERCPQGTELCDPPHVCAGLSHAEAVRWFVRDVEHRTLFLFNKNPRFRAVLLRVSGRETLYAFVNHWLDGYLQNPPEYRKKLRCTLRQ